MTLCPRCSRPTDRIAYACGRNGSVTLETQPLVCNRCLCEWALLRVFGKLRIESWKVVA